MRVPIIVKIAVLTVVATAFYTYVGQLVPQKRVEPPEVVEMSEDLSTEELVEIGNEIFNGKGLCSTCHTIGRSGALRFPDLQGIATRAADRRPGYGALDYLAESLYRPEAFIVAGFAGGMPQIDQPPIGLSDQEIRAVLAYLQTLGGEATITMETPIPFASGEAPEVTAAAEEAEAPETVAAASPEGSPEALLQSYGCLSCHGSEGDGPDLPEIGGLDRGRILDAVISHEGLEGAEEVAESGYYDAVSLDEARALADFLAGQGGGG